MATLEEIRRKNRELRAQIQAKDEIMKIGQERSRLLKEQKILLRAKKMSPEKLARQKRIAEKLIKVAKSTKRGFLKWGQRLVEAERREQEARKKATQRKRKKSPKKKKR